MKKIMLCVAPVAAGDPLINPRAIALDVYDCFKAGAAMVHLHVRDLNGRLTPGLTLLEETALYIRELCDIIIEVSTGGVSDLTIEERVQPCYASWVEAVSLNVGSVNLGEAVYQNPIKDVRYCVKQIAEYEKIPE
ncbi:MAG TPA: 3-keto-5-aminohexanoate cleavage protein, partial [Lachnospiraceae bacterium]|nr:3-keto-5-aminohexanoate cleavage protein [Lachnospiraceae bacterium]